MWIGYERFENSGSVIVVSSAYTVEGTYDAGVVPRRGRAAIRVPF